MLDDYPLEKLPIFQNIPAGQFEPLRQAAVRQNYTAGAAIFKQGDIPKFFYIVEEGIVDIVLPAVADDITVATFEAGSFFGELGVFDNEPRTATARAIVDTSLICVPVHAMADLIEHNPGAARQFMSVIIERLRSADEMLSRLKLRNVNEIADEKMTFGEKIADLVARFGGSWTFIIAFGCVLAVYATINVWLGKQAWDPYPFILLNLFLSMLASVQAPVIMMSQNRQDAKDRLRGELDYAVNRRAEVEIQGLARKLNLLGEKLEDVEELVRDLKAPR